MKVHACCLHRVSGDDDENRDPGRECGRDRVGEGCQDAGVAAFVSGGGDDDQVARRQDLPGAAAAVGVEDGGTERGEVDDRRLELAMRWATDAASEAVLDPARGLPRRRLDASGEVLDSGESEMEWLRDRGADRPVPREGRPVSGEGALATT